jgi:hypothetical protein
LLWWWPRSQGKANQRNYKVEEKQEELSVEPEKEEKIYQTTQNRLHARIWL